MQGRLPLWLAVVLYVAAAWPLLLVASCVPSSGVQLQAQTALNVLRDVIEPSYRFAHDSCTAQDDAITARAQAGALAKADAQVQAAKLERRCGEVMAQFDRIRRAHDEAATLLDQGEAEDAERLLEQVRAMWREIRPEG